MTPFFERSRWVAPDRGRLLGLLRGGPWFVPPSWSHEDGELRAARRAAEVGRFPLVACREEGEIDGGSLWVAAVPPAAVGGAEPLQRPFDGVADLWRIARHAVPCSLPLVWRRVAPAPEAAPLPRPLWVANALPAPGCAERSIPDRLQGASFGLAVALGLASVMVDEPYPPDLVATGCLDANGVIGPVEGLDQKIRVLGDWGAGVGRLLVSERQREAAERLAAGAFGVVGIESLRQAFHLLWPDLPEQLVTRGPQHVVPRLFGLAVAGRTAMADWKPVARAAELGLSRWTALEALDAVKLRIAKAIAERHQQNAGEMEVPGKDLLDRFPAPLRASLLAQVVQSAADNGRPTPAEARAAAGPYVVSNIADAYAEQLELLGAMARLDAVTGQPESALALALDVCGGWIDRLRPADSSHVLSLAYRLAGALRCEDAWGKAESLRAEVAADLSTESAAYVDLARSVAHVRLAGANAVNGLGAVIDSAPFPEIALTAARWQIEGLRRSAGAAVAARRVFEDLAANRDEDEVRCHRALVALDEAIAVEDVAGAQVALTELEAAEPGLAGHLIRAASQNGEGGGPLGRARYVQRFYPY